jgi:branched-chain amino acid transport system permease protein
MNWSGAQLWLALVGWVLVALCSLLVWALVRSPWGRVVKAIREDEDAARSLGKNVYAYKMQALVLGGVFGSLGGTVYALGLGSVNPDQYQNANTFLAYTALILGGAARVWGPVIGGAILLFLIQFADTGLKALISNGIIPETLLSQTDVAQLRFVLIGVGLMALLVFRPQGIFGDRREVMLDAR